MWPDWTVAGKTCRQAGKQAELGAGLGFTLLPVATELGDKGPQPPSQSR